MTDTRPQKPEHLIFLQYLRGIAALMVVVQHALRPRETLFSPVSADLQIGLAGVLVFFVISGFVMVQACGRDRPATFLRRRIIRVVPLYWVMTLAFFAVVLRGDIAAGAPFQRVPDLIQSLLFIPHEHFGLTGEVVPILVPGWTLNFEMMFFVVFAIGLAVGRPVVVATLILTGLVLLGQVDPGDGALWITWTSPLLLLFIAGVILAKFWSRYDLSRFWLLCPVAGSVLIAGSVGALGAVWAGLALSAASILTVLGVLGMQDRFRGVRLPFLGPIGDASYSIYLSHTILMIPLYKALTALPFDGWAQFAVVQGVTVVVCLIGGLLIYRLLERPMIVALRRPAPKPPSLVAKPPPPARPARLIFKPTGGLAPTV